MASFFDNYRLAHLNDIDKLIIKIYKLYPKYRYLNVKEDIFSIYSHEEDNYTYYHIYTGDSMNKDEELEFYSKVLTTLSIPHVVKKYAIVFRIPKDINLNLYCTTIKMLYK